MHWDEAAAGSGRSVLDRTAEVRRSNVGKEVWSQQFVVYSTANDCTRAVIDRSYKNGHLQN